MPRDEIKKYIEEEFPELKCNKLTDGGASFSLNTKKKNYNAIWSNRLLRVSQQIKLPVSSLVEKHKPENKNKKRRETEIELKYSTPSELRSQILEKVDVQPNFPSGNFRELLRFLVIHEAQQIVAAVPYETKTKELVDAAKDFLSQANGSRNLIDASQLPEEIDGDSDLFEGSKIQITINAYERNKDARTKCIKHFGAICSVCGMSFGEEYGEEIEGFIHVHHLKPLSKITEAYQVDPISDLRPVCPNCHAVIHLGGECRSIEAVKKMLKRKPARHK